MPFVKWLAFAGLILLHLSSTCTATASPLVNTTQCAALSALLPNKVSFPGKNTYVSSIASYFFVQARLTPSCIVTPESAEDVSTIIETLGRIWETSPSSTFAIRGGGHAPNVGAANVKQGVTVDLRAINDINIDADGSVTSVGGGALWDDAYSELDARNLSVVGGRVAGVGVGGSVTGGGLSTFSPEKGFSCDNVVNMEVVLASGQIVNANAESNPDLFAALKGGSNNFGVVTRFDLKSFPQGRYWGGLIQYPSSADLEQLQAFARFMEPSNFDPHAEIEQSFLYIAASKAFVSANNMFYTKPTINASALQGFTNIQPQLVNTMRISNVTDFAEEIASFQPVDQQGIYVTTTFRSSESFLIRVRELWNASVASVQQVDNLLYVLVFQTVPAAEAGNSLGLESSGYGQQGSGSLVLCLLAPSWANEADSPAMIAATERLVAAIETEAKAQGLYNRYQYLNYAASFQDPIGSYGPAAVESLRAVSMKYDPTGLFQNGVPGGFKLFT